MPEASEKVLHLLSNRACLEGAQEKIANSESVRREVVKGLSREELDWVRNVAAGKEPDTLPVVRANAVSLLGFDEEHSKENSALFEKLALSDDLQLALRAARAGMRQPENGRLLNKLLNEGNVIVALSACRALPRRAGSPAVQALGRLKKRIQEEVTDRKEITLRSVDQILLQVQQGSSRGP